MAFEYEHVGPEERVKAINFRLAQLEQEHVEVSAQVDTEGPEGDKGQKARQAEIEDAILKLRARRDGLKK